MVLICLFDLWGELGPGIYNCEATPPFKKNRGAVFTIVVLTLLSLWVSSQVAPSHRNSLEIYLGWWFQTLAPASSQLMDDPAKSRKHTETFLKLNSTEYSWWILFRDMKSSRISIPVQHSLTSQISTSKSGTKKNSEKNLQIKSKSEKKSSNVFSKQTTTVPPAASTARSTASVPCGWAARAAARSCRRQLWAQL